MFSKIKDFAQQKCKPKVAIYSNKALSSLISSKWVGSTKPMVLFLHVVKTLDKTITYLLKTVFHTALLKQLLPLKYYHHDMKLLQWKILKYLIDSFFLNKRTFWDLSAKHLIPPSQQDIWNPFNTPPRFHSILLHSSRDISQQKTGLKQSSAALTATASFIEKF